MSRSRRGALQVEPLEGKVLLSTAHASALAAARAAQVAAQPFSIAGTLKMPTTSVVTFQVSGQTMGSFKLSGKLGTMGQVNGKFVALLDANNNMTSGVLVLTARKGTVTLSMSPDTTDETAYDYTVSSGTGIFAAASGSGKMSTAGLSANGRTMTFVVTPR
jgi:hypothetical protein